MGKNAYIIFIVVLVAILGFWYYSNQQSANNPENTNQEKMMEDDTSMMNEESDSMMEEDDSTTEDDSMMASEVQEFRVVGTNFDFSEKEIRVKKGDTVRIVFVNEEGFHDWVVDEFDAATKQIQEGNQETIEFVADQAGEFEYYCSVGQHREMGMVGTLIVE
ncbi:hypothetical protein C0580_03015 [Candidatus Parcubacteria bacterium]|nr:MAG: hypothetical protein C0580_03015 [Candidatus Parcubacteria bacterium]